jgi:hypothetical protein
MLFSSSSQSFNTLPHLKKTVFPSKQVQRNVTSLKKDELPSFGDQIQYDLIQNQNFYLKAPVSKQMLSNFNSSVSIQTQVLNSTFEILSSAESSINDWQNDIEPDYGQVNISTISTGSNNFSRFNFSENSETPALGITNTKFNLSSNPSLTNKSTFLSFDFQIPFMSIELLNSPHTLALEFRFNNSSINFILSTFGVNFGNFLEENVSRSQNSDSLYIFCNETAPFGWKHINYNITRLITSYFSPQEYQKFSTLKTLFCYMFTFTPEYHLTLDIDTIKYVADLKTITPINYTIEDTIFSTENGSLSFNSFMGNFTFSINANTPWEKDIQVFLDVNISRKMEFYDSYVVKTWNVTHINFNINLFIPNLLEGAISSSICIILPSDWININIINQSIDIEVKNQSIILNEYLSGLEYRFHLFGFDSCVLEAWGPNYLTKIYPPNNLCRNELIKVRGDLRYPLPGNISLYIQNSSFLFQQNTIPMINSTFVFPEIMVDDTFPIGFLNLKINWSNTWEYGIFESQLYIYEKTEQQSIIFLHSSKYIEIFQYGPFFLNLSLVKDGTSYFTNSTIVFLINGKNCIFFSPTRDNNFILNISHVVWEPGEYELDIIASDGNFFFDKETVNLTIEPCSIFWNYEGLQTQLLETENVSFRLYSYVNLLKSGIFFPLTGFTIRVWMNDTVITDYKSNIAGYVDINLDTNQSTVGTCLQIAIGGILEDKILKFKSILIFITNGASPPYRSRANIFEIKRSNIIANKSYYVQYNIEYPTNNTNWYVPLEAISEFILSAYILRGNYVIGTKIEDQMLIWTLLSNISVVDTLVLELPSPTVFFREDVNTKDFTIKIDAFSDITTNNFSIEMDFGFLTFLASNLTLFDSLNRDITGLFLIRKEKSKLIITNLNILNGVKFSLFLKGELQNLEISIGQFFRSVYTYNESLVGSWNINFPISSSYTVFYSISGVNTQICNNTNSEVFPNTSSKITAILPPQKWNTSISVKLTINYLSGLVITSPQQNITIIDPFAPVLDYYVERKDDRIRIHSYAIEPDMASGVKNITLIMENHNITASHHSLYHHVFEIWMKDNTSHLAKIVVVDWAGNRRSSEFIEIYTTSLNSKSILSLWESGFFFPALFSIIIGCGILITRMIKKKKESIL